MKFNQHVAEALARIDKKHVYYTDGRFFSTVGLRYSDSSKAIEIGEGVDVMLRTEYCDSMWPKNSQSKVYISHTIDDDAALHKSIKGSANIADAEQHTPGSVTTPTGSLHLKGKNVYYNEKDFFQMDISNYNKMIDSSVALFIQKLSKQSNVPNYDTIVYPTSRSVNARDIAFTIAKHLNVTNVLVATKQNITTQAFNNIIDVDMFKKDCKDSITVVQGNMFDENLFDLCINDRIANWMLNASKNNEHFSIGTHFRMSRPLTILQQAIKEYNNNTEHEIQLVTTSGVKFKFEDYIKGSLFDTQSLVTNIQDTSKQGRVLFVDDNVTTGSMFSTLFNFLPDDLKTKLDFFFLTVQKDIYKSWVNKAKTSK